jgi:hypothetical protein
MISVVETMKPRRQPEVMQKLHFFYSSNFDSSDIAQRLFRGVWDDHLSYDIVMLNHRDKPQLYVYGPGKQKTWPAEKWIQHSSGQKASYDKKMCPTDR